MPGIDESKSFVPLRIAVLTVSDTRSPDDDKSGATLAERIGKAGHAVAARAIVTDVPGGDYCEWMSFQVGQAAKYAEADKKLAGA